MNILFLDQSGKLGGAELFLLDIAKAYRDRCLVALFADGDFRTRLEQHKIPVQVLLNRAISVRKDSGLLEGFKSLVQLLPLIGRVVQLSTQFDLIYANTQKALVVGAIASLLSRRPLVYHLHDILSPEHFSPTNLRLAIALANRFAVQVVATSEAARNAFVQAGGKAELATVVYNGFMPEEYQIDSPIHHPLDSSVEHQWRSLHLGQSFVVGHFSRLSPWKGQHVLIEALTHCSEDVAVILVGDALYGEQDYVQSLQDLIQKLHLQHRVHFLGFQSNIVSFMHLCDVITHTSIAPEPFGRVIVEAMLCDRPIIATAAGGAIEVVDAEVTGRLVPPGDVKALAAAIMQCRDQPEAARAIAQHAKAIASQRFHLDTIHQQLDQILNQVHLHQLDKLDSSALPNPPVILPSFHFTDSKS